MQYNILTQCLFFSSDCVTIRGIIGFLIALVMLSAIALVGILMDNGAADEGVPVADVKDHQQHQQEEAGQVKQDVVHIDIVDIVHIVMIVEAGIIILAVYIWIVIKIKAEDSARMKQTCITRE